MKLLTGSLNNTIKNTKEKITQAQNEIADSIRHLIIFSIIGLALSIVIICIAVIYLLKLQISPLASTTSLTVTKASEALNNLSNTASFLATQNSPNTRRFARRQNRLP